MQISNLIQKSPSIVFNGERIEKKLRTSRKSKTKSPYVRLSVIGSIATACTTSNVVTTSEIRATIRGSEAVSVTCTMPTVTPVFLAWISCFPQAVKNSKFTSTWQITDKASWLIKEHWTRSIFWKCYYHL